MMSTFAKMKWLELDKIEKKDNTRTKDVERVFQ